MSYNMQTEKGYSFYEASSALQKSIRRGVEADACYWAHELAKSGFEEYVWKRLQIMVSEDIGLASPYLPATIEAIYQSWHRHSKKQKGEGTLFILHAVILLARSPKSRLIDWAKCYYVETHDYERKEIPDYALDKHTQRGKAMGRRLKHFLEVGAVLNNWKEQPGEAFYRDQFTTFYPGSFEQKEYPYEENRRMEGHNPPPPYNQNQGGQ